MRSHSHLLGLLVLMSLTSCGGHSRAQPLPVATHPAGSCPVISDTTSPSTRADSAPHVLIRDGPPHFGYVSILIDGQWAAWNDGGSGPALGPDLKPDDVDHVEIVKGLAAQQRYGTCPGVGLIVITTKSRTWRPY